MIGWMNLIFVKPNQGYIHYQISIVLSTEVELQFLLAITIHFFSTIILLYTHNICR